MKREYEKLLLENSAHLKWVAAYYAKTSEDAEDLLQETLERILKKETSFQENTNFKAWSQTIMRNLFINGYRKEQNKRNLLQRTTRKILSAPSDTLENEGDHNLNLAHIEQVISKLSKRLSTPFLMYTNGYSYYEIASLLDVPIGTIKCRIHMARKKLQADLKYMRA